MKHRRQVNQSGITPALSAAPRSHFPSLRRSLRPRCRVPHALLAASAPGTCSRFSAPLYLTPLLDVCRTSSPYRHSSHPTFTCLHLVLIHRPRFRPDHLLLRSSPYPFDSHIHPLFHCAMSRSSPYSLCAAAFLRPYLLYATSSPTLSSYVSLCHPHIIIPHVSR